MKRIDAGRWIAGLLFLLLFSGGPLANEGRFYGAKETVYPDWFKESFLDLSEDVAEAKEQGKRLLLLFHQNGCPYCNRLIEHNLSQRAIKKQMQSGLDVVTINMWGDRDVTDMAGEAMTEKAFAATLRVQFTPTMLFLDEQGQVILRLNGYIPPEEFKVALDYVTGRHEGINFNSYLANNRPKTASGALNKALFFTTAPYDLSVIDAPIAVYFEQPQCPDCDRMHQSLLRDSSVLKPASRFHSIQLDMWSQTPVITPDGRNTNAREWANELGVSYAPTVILFDPKQGEVIRSEAMFKRFHTASLFEYVLTGSFREQPSFQRYLSARAETIRKSGNDVDIWR